MPLGASVRTWDIRLGKRQTVTCCFLGNWRYVRNTTSSCIQWEGLRVLNTSRALPSSSSTCVSPSSWKTHRRALGSRRDEWDVGLIPHQRQWPWPWSPFSEMTLEKMFKCSWRMLFAFSRKQLCVSGCLSRPGWCEDPTCHLYLCKVVFEQLVIRMHLWWELFSWAPLLSRSCAQKLAGFLIILTKY